MSDEIPQPPEESCEKKLCPGCLAPNDPSANFCVKCGAPLTPYAAIGPFESIQAQGYIYRRAAEQPARLIVVIGIWVIFGMMFLATLAYTIASHYSGRRINYGTALIASILMVISPLIIWKTTHNYISAKRAGKKSDD